jgi:hypothetical protein
MRVEGHKGELCLCRVTIMCRIASMKVGEQAEDFADGMNRRHLIWD